MSIETIRRCDVKREEHEGDVKERNLIVVFTTEQNEGCSTTPYLSLQTLDVCQKCYDRMIRTHTMLEAAGAQGNNDYYFAKAVR